MNNIKNNKGIFIFLLLGVLFWAFLTFLTIKGVFDADYVQIAGLILGSFFGICTILTLVAVLPFFGKKDIYAISWNWKWKKWKLFKYLPSAVAIVCFIISINFYHNKGKRYNSKYVEVMLTQINNSKIQTGGKGSRYVHIETKEYPKYKFSIDGIALKNLYSDYYINDVKRGDTLFAKISKEIYDKKIAKTKPLSFADKTVNYHLINMYGLKHQNVELLSTDDYEYAKENDAIWGVVFLIVVGCYFLYLQHKLNKEKNEEVQVSSNK